MSIGTENPWVTVSVVPGAKHSGAGREIACDRFPFRLGQYAAVSRAIYVPHEMIRMPFGSFREETLLNSLAWRSNATNVF
jgi:hypothetical protein